MDTVTKQTRHMKRRAGFKLNLENSFFFEKVFNFNALGWKRVWGETFTFIPGTKSCKIY